MHSNGLEFIHEGKVVIPGWHGHMALYNYNSTLVT